jgi:hypothetical protein
MPQIFDLLFSPVTRDWVDYATFVVLTATLTVVAIYTWLTQRLRVAAEKQNESNVLPILILHWPNPEFDNVNTPSVENIGTGPAFNVQIAPITHGTVKVEFSQFGLLQVKERYASPMHISQVVEETPKRLIQRGHRPSTETLVASIRNHGFPASFTVTIRYEDLARKPYETGFNVKFDPLRERFDVTFGGMKKL